MNTQLKLAFLAFSMLMLGACAKVSIKDGISAYEDLRYQDAITHLEKGLSKVDSDPGRRALAESYLKTNNFQKSKEIYEQLIAGTSSNDDDRINYGRALMTTGSYNEAIEVFNGVLSRDPSNEIAQSLKSSCKNINTFLSDSSAFSVASLDIGEVTSAYAPFATENGLFFSGERSAAGEKDQYTGLKYTDLYYMPASGDSASTPTKVEGVNGKYHDGIASVSADGNTMILTKSYYNSQNKQLRKNAANVNMTQLYSSTKGEDGKWTNPELLSFMDENYMFAHPALSPDGKTLYFSSDIAGGYGGMDLYRTTLENEEWKKPENLGNKINTPGNELFPALRSADSLYFSSNAHNTIGGQDLQLAVQQGNSWNGPFHLPSPINSAFDDFGMTFVPGTPSGYFSSDREGFDHIYTFVENEILYTLNGIVTRKVNGDPINGAMITVSNLTDGTEEVFYSDDIGMFELSLLPGKEYRIRAEKDGYFAIKEDVSTVSNGDDREMNLNLSLLDISNPDGTADNGSGNDNGSGIDNGSGNNNQPYAIPNIMWDYNMWDIREDARPYLDSVAKLLKDNPDLKVEISSHCDSRGSNFFNKQLSEKRAKAVTDYLVKKGIRRSALISKGYGEKRLLNNCDDSRECSESEHQLNRRTEFKVID